MAVLGRVLFSSAERVDLPDLLSIDSYAAGDWKYFLQSMVGTARPCILTGFDVINPETAIGSATCSVRVADSVVYFPGSAAGPFFYGLPEGDTNSVPLTPQLRANSTNYIYLTLTTVDTAADTRALWDPDRDGGAGAEFTQNINTQSVIQAQINVSTGSFPSNTLPIAVVVMGPAAIVSIQDARDMMFRLGTGGLNPDPLNTYSFRSLPSSTYARLEPSTTISSSGEPNPFFGGDKNIRTLKEWMDVVMTKLKELGGTRYWYEETETYNLVNIFNDALAGSWKSKGSYTHSSNTPGLLSWSDDIYFKRASSPKDLVIRASGANPLTLQNEQVAYIGLVRNRPVNTLDMPVEFKNGQAYVNTVGGSVGLFESLKKGDWVKKASDPDTMALQVMEFYNDPAAVGTVTTAANARSIKLSGAYQGSTSQTYGDRARFDRGEYLPTDIVVRDRSSADVSLAGGDLFWFAMRSDNILGIASINRTTVSGTVTSVTGEGVVVQATAHGLLDGDRITVTAPAGHAGTYSVEVIDNDSFTFQSIADDIGGFVGYFAIATLQERTTDYGFKLESAKHGLDSGETVVISGTSNYDGKYVVSVRSATQFQIAVPSALPNQTSAAGVATVSRIDARSEEGINKILQGDTVDIGQSSTTDKIRSFIGMSTPDQTAPLYAIPTNFGTLNDGANYNGSSYDTLTARISKNTAALMDKAQDKTIQFVTTAREAINAANGAVRNLYFTPNSTLTIVKPGSPGNAVITLPTAASPLQLAVNTSAYVSIHRNAASTPAISTIDTAYVPIDENVFVVATRLSGTEVYLWNGDVVNTTLPIVQEDSALVSIARCDPVSTALPTGSVTIDGLAVIASDLVLFTNLNTGRNIVYRADGVTTNITGWTQQYYFHGNTLPVAGDAVIVRRGTAFGLQVGKFNGTDWVFNEKIRCFNGVDYFEQSNIVSATLTDNTTDTLFTIDWANNEHMVIDYSVVRGTTRETGTMHVVTDGVTVSVNTNSSYVNGDTGVKFSARISGITQLVFEYTTSSTGNSASMKYMVRRWSSGTGGPAGIPSYSGAAPAPTPAAGAVNSIQINSGGSLASNTNFQIDTVDLSMNLNDLRQGILSGSIELLNNATSWTDLFTMSLVYPFIVVEYSVEKENFARVGSLLVACDANGTVACTDTKVETGTTGFEIQVVKVDDNIQFQYKTTNGTGAGTFKYSWRKWK